MDEIFYLVRHGGGGFNYWDCYRMPTQIRKFNKNKLNAEITEENEKIEKAKAKQNGNLSMDEMATGDVKQFKTDYISKAPTKK
jgi:hypothetical protein